MLNLIPLLLAATTATAFAVPKIEVRQQGSPLQITHVSYDGPTCNSSNASVPLTASDAGIGATAQMGFDSEKAFAKPEAGNIAYSDCTVTVDFTFPVSFNLNSVQAIAKGDSDFDDGMRQDVKLDVWFPNRADIVATNTRLITSAGGPVSQSFDLETHYLIPNDQDFWDACYGQSQVKVRIQQDATSTASGNGRSYAYTKIEGLVIKLDEGSNGGRYTSFCGASTGLGGGGITWSGSGAQPVNLPAQCTGILCSLGLPSISLPTGGVWSGLGLSGSSITIGP